MNSQILRPYAQDLYGSVSDGILELKEKWVHTPIPNQEANSDWQPLEKENLVFLQGSLTQEANYSLG